MHPERYFLDLCRILDPTAMVVITINPSLSTLWRWNDPSPARGKGSRLKVSRCQETAIHVERDRRVLMGDLPGTVDTSQAYCYALPPLYTLTVGFGPGAYLIKAVTEGEVAACGNGQVATLLIEQEFADRQLAADLSGHRLLPSFFTVANGMGGATRAQLRPTASLH